MWTEMPRYPLQQLLSSKLKWKNYEQKRESFPFESKSQPSPPPRYPPSPPHTTWFKSEKWTKSNWLQPAFERWQYFNWTKPSVLPVMWHVDLRLRCRYPRYQCQYRKPEEHKHFNSSLNSLLTSMTIIYHFKLPDILVAGGWCLLHHSLFYIWNGPVYHLIIYCISTDFRILYCTLTSPGVMDVVYGLRTKMTLWLIGLASGEKIMEVKTNPWHSIEGQIWILSDGNHFLQFCFNELEVNRWTVYSILTIHTW